MRYFYLFLWSLLVACAKSPKMDTPLPPQLTNPYLKQPSEKALYTPVKKLTLADGLSSNKIQRIFKDSKGFIWIGTLNGLNRYDGITIKNYWHDSNDSNSLRHNNVWDIAEDSLGNILVLTQKGVNWIRPNQIIHAYTQSDWAFFFYKHKVRAIFEAIDTSKYKGAPVSGTIAIFIKDSKNNFFKIELNQLSKVDTSLFKSSYEVTHCRSNGYGSITIDNNDSIEFQEKPHGRISPKLNLCNSDLSQLNGIQNGMMDIRYLNYLLGTSNTFNYLFTPADLEPTSLLIEQNNIWIGTYTGAIYYSNQTNLFDNNASIGLLGINDSIFRFNQIITAQPFQDSKNRIWVGSYDGLYEFSNPRIGKPIRYAEHAGFQHPHIKKIQEGASGQLWIDTGGGGVSVFSPRYCQVIKTFAEFDGIVNQFFKDSQNRIWIGTDIGLYQIIDIEKGTYLYYAQQAGFQHPQIETIQEDTYGQLWIGTNGGGIVVFSPKLERVIKTFTEEDGLLENTFYANTNAEIAKGYLAFDNGDKRVIFHPDSLYRNAEPPNVVITSLTANEVEKYSADLKNYTFTLPYDSNSLIITPRVLDLNNSHRNKIRYKLEGVDADYCKPLAIKDLHYPHLAAGDYTLLIQGANSHGVWNPIPTRCHITILPAWWQTWWFHILVGGFLIVLSSRFFYMRQRHTNQKHQRETDALQARVLQAQLNPHFIFNVLTLVQSKIMNESPQDASDLLVRLSKLLRNFLESSILSSHESGQFHEIELEKELELLTEYIDFERLKNDCRFEYYLNIASDIEPSDEKLPPFFIQPYVENAIKHGLLYRNDEQGILTITFEKKLEQGDSYLVCTVSDNGVGRNQAKALQNKDKKLYKSRGTELIENRIQILNLYKYAIQIDTYDNQPSGTKVVIQFKYKS